MKYTLIVYLFGVMHVDNIFKLKIVDLDWT